MTDLIDRDKVSNASKLECSHPETKSKLVAWAQSSRYGHEQGFMHKDCCVCCGEVVEIVDKQESD